MQKSKGTIRRERPADYAAVERLTRGGLFGMCIARGAWSTMWCTSSGTIPPLFQSWILCWKGRRLIGRPLYAGPGAYRGWRILPVMTFGPISIHP